MKAFVLLLAVSAAGLNLAAADQSVRIIAVPEGQGGPGFNLTVPAAQPRAAAADPFQAFDLNADGSLSRQEFARWQLSLPGGVSRGGASNDSTPVNPGHPAFRMVDSDRDGQVTREEFDRR